MARVYNAQLPPGMYPFTLTTEAETAYARTHWSNNRPIGYRWNSISHSYINEIVGGTGGCHLEPDYPSLAELLDAR